MMHIRFKISLQAPYPYMLHAIRIRQFHVILETILSSIGRHDDFTDKTKFRNGKPTSWVVYPDKYRLNADWSVWASNALTKKKIDSFLDQKVINIYFMNHDVKQL
jgi:geranylgeranyl pyrophosphate synthase